LKGRVSDDRPDHFGPPVTAAAIAGQVRLCLDRAGAAPSLLAWDAQGRGRRAAVTELVRHERSW
jgi:hypothetical protein